MSRRMYWAGDVVEHVVTQELWILACDQVEDQVYPAGWPGHGEAPVDLFVPVQPATLGVRFRMLSATAGQERRRPLIAKRQLAALSRGEILDDEEPGERMHERSLGPAVAIVALCLCVPLALLLLGAL